MNYFAVPGIVLRKRYLSLDKLLMRTCEFFGVPKKLLVSKSRKREYAEARMFFYYYAKTNCNYTLVEIGELTSGRDHTTVIHGIKTVKNLCHTDEKYKELLESYMNYMQFGGGAN